MCPRSFWKLLVFVVGFGAVIALATDVQTAEVIHACVKRSGVIRVVMPDEACRQHETRLSWSAEVSPGPGPVPTPRGVKDFATSGAFMAPEGVTEIVVQAWGGGGGGGGSADLQPGCARGGGGGGGGGYVHGVVEVTPGVTYTVTVGDSGAGGAPGGVGSAGGNTSLTDGALVLIVAEGGLAGQ
ncbi:MAG: hypothetical protein HYT88_07085, partial [Candidatus Omnitrophica bacterium]|nr:hypothetical protein [Candidatus Omnitrophota bacterium]